MEGRDLLAGRYELRGVLGRGGMAAVHDGWDTRLDRAVAIKLLYPAFAADEHMRRRFEAEARAAAGLSHPNIVAVHDSGEHDGTPFIVMERLPGRTLADLIASGPMSPHRVHAMLCDVLGALTIAHAAGILHRDIKPGNVLLTGDGSAMKVADFGIAKTAGAAHTATGQIVGTMAYMSPERVSGAAASVADDLYAVGVMGYEALTGQRPFRQENPAALLHAILDAPPPPISAVRPDLDPTLAATIDRAMARDVTQRFGSAEHMRDALRGAPSALLMGPAPAAAPRPATKILAEPIAPSANYYVAPAPRRPMSRERKLLLAAAAFVALVVAGLALALDPSSTTQPPQPIGTSTPAPPPPPPPTSSPPPPSSAVPIVEHPKPPKKNGNGNNGRGNSNGNGNGKKRD